MNHTIDPQASARLPSVVERLGVLSSDELEVIEHVLAQLEINRTAADLGALTDDLAARGVLDQLPDIIAKVRASHQQAAS